MAFLKVATIIFAMAVNCCFAHVLNRIQGSKLGLRNRYDFIIVGAGSAGSVVANRLSEIDDVTVLLLEAGGEEDPILNEIPNLYGVLMRSYQDWNFTTVEQNSTFFSATPKKLIYPRGKILGGTSSINAMIYARGNRKDYDTWDQEVGGGWSWDEVLPYFRKSEDNRADNLDESYHGKGGFLTVTETTVKDSLSDLFLRAANEVGLPTRDLNGENQTGVMPFQFTTRDGARCSTNKAFLKSAAERRNLHILIHAHVKKVILKTTANNKAKATGVIFQCGNKELTVTASKEVILSAGTIQSPQLLLLSGIGPKDQLKQYKIPVKTILPGVGENFRDHLVSTGLYFVSESINAGSACPASSDFRSQLLEWGFNRAGPLTSSLGSPDVSGFSSISNDNRINDWPDIQLAFTQPFPIGGTKLDDSAVSTCIVILLRAQGKGFVKLGSVDPMAPPIIDPRYFSRKSDLDDLISGVKICKSFANTTAFRSAGIRFKIHKYSLCANFNDTSDEYLRCAVQEMFNPGWHCVGTCKMGKNTDPMAVVDSKLRVHNVAGLRVIDASIMPNTPSGNTNAPSIMVGERGADFIKEFWNFTAPN